MLASLEKLEARLWEGRESLSSALSYRSVELLGCDSSPVSRPRPSMIAARPRLEGSPPLKDTLMSDAKA